MLRQFSSAPCKRCGSYAPLRNTAFHRHIGMIVLMQHSRIETHLCRRCIDEVFWNYTLTTLLLGWWGVMSFFITPFILLYNLYSYCRALSLPQGAAQPIRTVPPPLPVSPPTTTPPPLPPIMPTQAREPVQATIAPSEDECELSIAAHPELLPAGTQFGRYRISSHTPGRLTIKRYSPFSFYCGLIALGCMVASGVGLCLGLGGHREFAELLVFLPFGLISTLLWLRARPGTIHIDARTQQVSLSSVRTSLVWSRSDYYAVYIDTDSEAPARCEPMLSIIIAERLTTQRGGGTCVARCPATALACANLVQLAAVVAQMLHLPLRCTQEARNLAAPRVGALLASHHGIAATERVPVSAAP